MTLFNHHNQPPSTLPKPGQSGPGNRTHGAVGRVAMGLRWCVGHEAPVPRPPVPYASSARGGWAGARSVTGGQGSAGDHKGPLTMVCSMISIGKYG